MEKVFSDLVASNMTFEDLINNGTALAEVNKRIANSDTTYAMMWRQYGIMVYNLLQRDEIQV